MAKGPMAWTCPHCVRPTTLTEHNYSTGFNRIDVRVPEHDSIGLWYAAIACPALDCKKLALTVALKKGEYREGEGFVATDQIQIWRILPESSAKPQPDYIPEPLRNDYLEACRISTLSPKASATLSRRCLQGMIRDFWKTTKKPNLKQEIEAIQGMVEPATWKAIDAIREVGNVGAHMEQDINLIVEVDSDEAELLIRLIETLFKDWYVTRQEHYEQMVGLVTLAETKKKKLAEKKKAIYKEAGEAQATGDEGA